MAGFGGGIATGDVCGAITGAIGVIGVIFTETSGHENPIVREMTREFIRRFKEKLGFIKCIDLKKEYINIKRCTLMIETGTEILDDIISEKKYN